MFRSFPANAKVDRDTLQDYCEAVSRYPGSVVERAVEQFRLGKVERHSRTFAPSIPELLTELRRTGMSADERSRLICATNTKLAIDSQPNVIALAQKEAKRRAGE